MLHTLLAIKMARLLSTHVLPFLAVISTATTIVATTRLAGQGPEMAGLLDLTAQVPRNEQGYYHGIPGMSGGGASGGWWPGPGDTVRYELPLGLEILHASPTKEGNFAIEVLLRNADSAPFDLPTSRNLTAVEKPGNSLRRVFFFSLKPAGGSTREGETLGFAATGGSTSIPGSFITLDPGKSLRVLLLASSDSGEGDRREVSFSLKLPIITSQTSHVRQLSEYVPSVPRFQAYAAHLAITSPAP